MNLEQSLDVGIEDLMGLQSRADVARGLGQSPNECLPDIILNMMIVILKK